MKDEYIGDLTGSTFIFRANFLSPANSLLEVLDEQVHSAALKYLQFPECAKLSQISPSVPAS